MKTEFKTPNELRDFLNRQRLSIIAYADKQRQQGSCINRVSRNRDFTYKGGAFKMKVFYHWDTDSEDVCNYESVGFQVLCKLTGLFLNDGCPRMELGFNVQYMLEKIC